MAKGEGKGESAAKLANQIACIKYTIFCFNIVAWVSNFYVKEFFHFGILF
jgi:hypothetical protein